MIFSLRRYAKRNAYPAVVHGVLRYRRDASLRASRPSLSHLPAVRRAKPHRVLRLGYELGLGYVERGVDGAMLTTARRATLLPSSTPPLVRCQNDGAEQERNAAT